MSLFFSFMILIGQIISLISYHFLNASFFILGRFIFGIGGESINISIMIIIIKLFRKGDLSLALVIIFFFKLIFYIFYQKKVSKFMYFEICWNFKLAYNFEYFNSNFKYNFLFIY